MLCHQTWLIRMPNFIKVEAQPFEHDIYQPAEDPGTGLSSREQSMGIKLEVENTIRWRWVKGPDGELVSP